jgi:uncharacterized membrane protein
MFGLIAAAAVFIAMRRVVSGTSLRGVIVARIGERLYFQIFSLASVVAVAWLGFAYAQARTALANVTLFETGVDLRPAQFCLQLVAFVLIVTGLTTPNPTIASFGKLVRRDNIARGILRVTRHPFLWGVVLFAIGHFVMRPDLAGLILFGTLAFVALTGTRSIDAKRSVVWGDAWKTFAERTSNVPFAAIAAGRQTFRPAEIGWQRLGAALAIFMIFAALHPLMFGTRAWP